MGTKMAPSYGNIFMGRLEKQLLQSVTPKPLSWLRFIDDIDMKWIHGRKHLKHFSKQQTASFQPLDLLLRSQMSNTSFLDTTSHFSDNKVAVDLYTKPTDSHQYLLPTSCHPPHCSKNIPYSLALRIRRICFDDEAFDKRV